MVSEVLTQVETWQKLALAYSAHIAVEQKGNKPIPVNTAEHGAYLYTVFGVFHRSWGERSKPSVDAWKLLPVSMYDGETTLVYHDSKAIESGVRKRGDMTGLIVSVKGNLMVCVENVHFLMDMPTTPPLSISEATTYDEKQRKAGWRAIFFNGKSPEWAFLRGHPVAVYRRQGLIYDDMAIMFWKHDGVIHELRIDHDDVYIEDKPSLAQRSGLQLALF